MCDCWLSDVHALGQLDRKAMRALNCCANKGDPHMVSTNVARKTNGLLTLSAKSGYSTGHQRNTQ